jgi:malonyl CoA-acyl carrier protein transacylase
MRLSDFVKNLAARLKKKEEMKESKNVSGAFFNPYMAMRIARNNRNKHFKRGGAYRD